MDAGVGGVDGLGDGGGRRADDGMKEEEGGGAGFGRGSDGADKQLRRRRRADASMDQSDPGLPQPWAAHCSQGTKGRHLRGWTLGVGPTLAALGRAPTVSHGQGAPPQTMIRAVWVCYLACRLLACSPPLPPPPRNPRTWNPRAALSYRPWAEEETRRVGEGDGRGVCLPRGSMFGGADATGCCRKPKSMMCCLEETDGNREDMDGQHDGVSIQAVSELCVVVPEWKPSDCPIGSRGAAQGSAGQRSQKARRGSL